MEGGLRKDMFGKNKVEKPIVPVPASMPEEGFFFGLLLNLLGELCGLAGYAGISALVAHFADVLSGSRLDTEVVGMAILATIAGFFVGDVIACLKFLRVRRYLRKNGHVEAIRRDTLPEMQNTINAWGLRPISLMLRYIKKLNPMTGAVLAVAVKNNRKKERKRKLGYVPYLMTIALAGLVPLYFEWVPWDQMTTYLIVVHLITAVVMGIYGYKKEWDHRLLAAGMVVCGAIVWAFFGLGLWYHILINLVAAFIGMYIGEGKRNRKKKAES